MKKYLMHLKFEWQALFEYRGSLFIYTVSSMVVPLIGLAIWLAVLASGASLSYTNSELILYFLLTIFVGNFTSAWSSPYLAEKINNGTFSIYLLKPYSFVLATAISNIAEKIYKLIFIIISFTGVIYFFIHNFTFEMNVLQLALFLISLVMAAVIFFVLDIIIGLTAIWTHDILFLRNHFLVFNQFFSGRFIPLAFFPASALQTIELLPFRYTVSFPIEIILNKLSNEQLLKGLIIQITWVIVSIAAYKLILKLGIKSYQGYGA